MLKDGSLTLKLKSILDTGLFVYKHILNDKRRVKNYPQPNLILYLMDQDKETEFIVLYYIDYAPNDEYFEWCDLSLWNDIHISFEKVLETVSPDLQKNLIYHFDVLTREGK